MVLKTDDRRMTHKKMKKKNPADVDKISTQENRMVPKNQNRESK